MRDILIDLAAERWQTDRGELVAADGRVSDPKKQRSITFGELTQGKKLARAIPETTDLTPAAHWKTIGRTSPKADGRDFLTGKHRYSTDIKLDGMWHGKVLRPSSFGATLVSIDTSRAEAMADVKVVKDGSFIGAAAASEQRAAEPVGAIQPEWKPAAGQPSAGEIFEYFKKNPVGRERF